MKLEDLIYILIAKHIMDRPILNKFLNKKICMCKSYNKKTKFLLLRLFFKNEDAFQFTIQPGHKLKFSSNEQYSCFFTIKSLDDKIPTRMICSLIAQLDLLTYWGSAYPTLYKESIDLATNLLQQYKYEVLSEDDMYQIIVNYINLLCINDDKKSKFLIKI